MAAITTSTGLVIFLSGIPPAHMNVSIVLVFSILYFATIASIQSIPRPVHPLRLLSPYPQQALAPCILAKNCNHVEPERSPGLFRIWCLRVPADSFSSSFSLKAFHFASGVSSVFPPVPGSVLPVSRSFLQVHFYLMQP